MSRRPLSTFVRPHAISSVVSVLLRGAGPVFAVPAMVALALCAACAVFATPLARAESPSAAPPAPHLRAGFATADITPGREATLVGYGFRRPGNDGVAHALAARAVVLQGEDAPVAIVVLDLAVVPTAEARRLRQAIAAELKTEPARVLVAATHTHSGPQPDAAYFDGIRDRVIDAARRAASLKYPVRLETREAPLGLGYNRRVPTAAGVRHNWNPQQYPERSPAAAPDPTCTVVLLRQDNGPRRTLLWSLGAHPVVLGKTSRVVSSDYPGRANALLEAEAPGTGALFAQGAAGNVHPWIATQESPAFVEPVARAAAAFVALLAQATEPVAAAGPLALQVRAGTVRVGEGDLDLAVWRAGNLWIVGAPVEMFGESALALRKGLGGGPVFLVTLANGWHGYWPTRAAAAEGGYETEPGKTPKGFKPGDAERLVEALLALAEPLRAPRAPAAPSPRAQPPPKP